jgi:GNAT superfamily N-acetyltransferase
VTELRARERSVTRPAVAAIQVRPVSVAQTRPLRRAVLRPHQSLEEMRDSEPQDAWAVGAFDGDALVAVGLIGPDAERGAGSWRVRGMATEARLRGRGCGTALLDALLDHARANRAHGVWCTVRTPARSLYERAGFRVRSDEFEIPEIGPHFVMELALQRDG